MEIYVDLTMDMCFMMDHSLVRLLLTVATKFIGSKARHLEHAAGTGDGVVSHQHVYGLVSHKIYYSSGHFLYDALSKNTVVPEPQSLFEWLEISENMCTYSN